MIEKMTKYSFVLLNSDRSGFLDTLQDLGVMDITRSRSEGDSFCARCLAGIDAQKLLIKQIETLSNPEIEELRSEVQALSAERKEVLAWGEYDTQKLAMFSPHFYSVSAKNYKAEWQEQWPLCVASESEGKVNFVIVGDNSGFPLRESPVPLRTASQVKAEISLKENAIADAVAALEARTVELPGLQAEIHDLEMQLSRHLADVSGEDAAEGSIIVYSGFAPTALDAELKDAFDAMDIIWMSAPARTADKPPIKLKNNRFTEQFQVLTGMYGLPAYNEFDPTTFLSIFFLLFFAMCMGDAGYGLLLIGIGFLLRGREGGLAKLWSLIVTLGVGTFVVGLVMGGFFGIDLSAQPWVPDGLKKLMITGDVEIGGNSYSKQMVLALGIGVLHISLALIMKAVWAVRKDGLRNSLSAVGWTLLIVGGVIALAVGLAGVISQEAMKWLLIAIAAISALGIFIFNKWGRNPLVNIGSGLWDTYSMASGLMGDVLSYIRLYALGLSGGMLGATFNQIAQMVKGTDPTWQWVPFVLILIVGHALNLAMSCLGAFVHPLRLNFVEFFKNSGYEGSGREYDPLRK